MLEYHVLLMKLAGIDGVIVDGYLSAQGIQIETSSNLMSKDWQIAKTFPISTNPVIFNATISPQSPTTFLRIRNDGL